MQINSQVMQRQIIQNISISGCIKALDFRF